MGFIGTSSTTVNGGIPVFQKIIETAQGGFTLDREDTTPAGTIVKAGTPVTFNEATRLASISGMTNLNVKGLLKDDITVPDDDEPEVDLAVVIRGTVYERRIVDEDGAALTIASNVKAALPNIIFSQSY